MAFGTARAIFLSAGLIGVFTCTEMLWAQSPQTQPGSPITDIRQAAERVALSDPRMKAILGEGQLRVASGDVEMDKGEAESFLEGTSDRRPTSRVVVTALNVQTNIAARAVVSVPQYRVLAVERVPADDMPLVRADADDALALAKASPEARNAVGETLALFRILDMGGEERVPFAAEVLPLRFSNPDEPCSVDRCLALIFRTENGYLGVGAHVDLTRRTVTVSGGQPR